MGSVMSNTRHKILVVDDEPDVVSYLTTFLEDEGFTVVSAQDGPNGIVTARAERPDLITLDITMPGMSGIEVLTILRRDPELNPIPVIVITGVTSFKKQLSFRGVRPPEAFMQKPMDLELLMSNIDNLLELSALRSTNE
ncbi:MAG: response regulator [Proteobacteria bacterium]|nr:response regulator [Pseudomonadota bacterium]